jgi:phage/conjugal plasmid C-4 type zinc finger TraR family protein
MADVIDQADEYTARGLAARIAEIRAGLSETETAIECEDCGEEIPEARRRAVPGCRCCVECQEERERGR